MPDNSMHKIKTISLLASVATLESGDVVPIAQWFDAMMDECQASDAVGFIAGPTPDGKWLVDEISTYAPVVKN